MPPNLRTPVFLLVVLICAAGIGVRDAIADDAGLYEAKAITTGTGEKNRRLGFALCLRQVILKVSGNQRLLAVPAYQELQRDMGKLVVSYSYRDRYSDIPLHDEQGSNDRPHDLTCRYDPVTLDSAIKSLGGMAWLAQRPTIPVFLAVHEARRTYVLAGDGDENPPMLESFTAAADYLGLTVRFPGRADLEDAGIADDSSASAVQVAARRVGGLAGTLTFSNGPPGWIAEWALEHDGQMYRWAVRGVNFDEAFRIAMRGAAQILSGNGQP